MFLAETEQYDAAKTALDSLLGPARAASQLLGYSGRELLGGVSLTAVAKNALDVEVLKHSGSENNFRSRSWDTHSPAGS